MDSRKPWMRFGGAASLLAGGLIAGGVLAGTLTANAAEERATPGSSTSPAAAEEPLTGDVQERVEAAVLAAYPDATIERAETDSGGVYESHIVTTDGDRLTVLVDEEFAVTGTETGGRGPGGGDCPEDDAAAGTSESPGTGTPSTEIPPTETPDSTDGSSGS